MHIGQTRIIMLSDAKKVASARVTCTQMKNEEGFEFLVKCDYLNRAVSITRTR